MRQPDRLPSIPRAGTRVFSLNVHATYACGRSGVCCTSAWPIPVEPHLRVFLGVDLIVPRADGSCPFYDARGRLCAVQRDHGQASLPTSCHDFPRVTLRDARGLFVALSLYCPTAAQRLVDFEEPLGIVEHPAAFPAERNYDALDATEVWPPLVRPDLLFDLDSYALWERTVVTMLGGHPRSADTALAALDAIGERLRTWTPAHGPMAAYLESIARAGAPDAGPAAPDARWRQAVVDHDVVCGLILPGLEVPAPATPLNAAYDAWVADTWDSQASRTGRYLAAKAFGAWTAYQGRGVRTSLRELRLAASVLLVEAARACARAGTTLDRDRILEAIRAADLILVHHVGRDRLMVECGRAEDEPPLLAAPPR